MFVKISKDYADKKNNKTKEFQIHEICEYQKCNIFWETKMNTGVIYILHKFDHIDALPVKY